MGFPAMVASAGASFIAFHNDTKASPIPWVNRFLVEFMA